jgi:tetratricopeptide (TPR) repeat protein
MSNSSFSDEKELEAIKLIDQAETLADRGKGEEAINFYEKAASIYLDLGSYIKLDELYIRITQIISRFKNNIQATYRLKSIIRKTEDLKLYEVSAKLLIQLGNITYNMRDWETAGECWEKASEYLYEIDPEEFNSLSSIFLLKAGQAFERSRIKKDYGKNLILRAVMKINKFDELYEQEEKRALNLLSRKEFESSAKKFNEIASYFKKALENLGDLIDEEKSKDTMLNAKARFIHFVAEYQTVAALCLRASENREHNQKIKELGTDSIQRFKESISLLKSYLQPQVSDFDNEVILRITFDTMLMAIIQGMLGTSQLNSIEFLLEKIEDNKKLVKELKNSPYFKIAKRIEQVGIREVFDDLLKLHLGHFESIKNTLITYFK